MTTDPPPPPPPLSYREPGGGWSEEEGGVRLGEKEPVEHPVDPRLRNVRDKSRTEDREGDRGPGGGKGGSGVGDGSPLGVGVGMAGPGKFKDLPRTVTLRSRRDPLRPPWVGDVGWRTGGPGVLTPVVQRGTSEPGSLGWVPLHRREPVRLTRSPRPHGQRPCTGPHPHSSSPGSLTTHFASP